MISSSGRFPKGRLAGHPAKQGRAQPDATGGKGLCSFARRWSRLLPLPLYIESEKEYLWQKN